jgi:hypothetical protein
MSTFLAILGQQRKNLMKEAAKNPSASIFGARHTPICNTQICTLWGIGRAAEGKLGFF